VPDLRVCPNCGAYVITDRNVCPRCDAPLDDTAPQSAAPRVETDDPVADVLAEIDAAQTLDEGEPPAEAAPWLPHVEAEPEPAGEGIEPAPGEEGTASQPVPAREDRPTMPGWMPEATLPAVQVKPPAPAEPDSVAGPLDAHDRPTSPSLDVDRPGGHAPARAPFEAEVTLARLPENIEDELVGVPSSEPTMQFDRKLHAEPPREAEMTSPARAPEPVAAPPLSALRPPMQGWSPYPYGGAQNYWDAATRYFQQRIQAYLDAGYRAHVHAAHEATLSLGKQLGALGWVLAILSVIGALWYVLILALSGFRPDMAYLTLEADGRVYEDGPGAAHVRRERWRAGRRWSLIGLAILALSLVLAIVLGVVVGLALQQERNRAAFSEVTFFGALYANTFDIETDITPSAQDVARAENATVAASLLGGLALIGIWGGATLLVIGTVHAQAYRTRVPPLPGYA